MINYREPEYEPIFTQRAARLIKLRGDPTLIPMLKLYYRDNIAQFISDWGVTVDPRLVSRDIPSLVPFLLFPRQVECVDWIVEKWRSGEPGLIPKSREMGMSWLAVSVAVALGVLYEGIGVGFGSRKEEYVDKSGSPKALFWKAREFIRHLPSEFRAGCDVTVHAPHMRIHFPDTGSTITGEAGDNIGRGDRQSLYVVDEGAFLERPMIVEAALSQTTNCRIDISSANGMANPFAQKVHSWPEDRIFRFHWRDDPRKGDEWYAKQELELDPVTLAQEVDMNFAASATGILIQPGWIQSAINAHIKLGISVTGRRMAAMDVADGGPDKNALCIARGILIESVEAWQGGKEEQGDIFKSVEYVFTRCDEAGVEEWWYDADGMGAGVRGDARVINERRTHKQTVKPWRGSGEVFDKDRQIPTAAPMTEGRDRIERLNEDFFQNAKAQAWYSLALRFQRTHRAVKLVEAGELNPYDHDDLISISADMPADQLRQLTLELSQPTRTTKAETGKMIIDKAPEGTRSPNHADAVMIRYAPRKMGSFWTA
jgi:phage terminase large subunit